MTQFTSLSTPSSIKFESTSTSTQLPFASTVQPQSVDGSSQVSSSTSSNQFESTEASITSAKAFEPTSLKPDVSTAFETIQAELSTNVAAKLESITSQGNGTAPIQSKLTKNDDDIVSYVLHCRQ